MWDALKRHSEWWIAGGLALAFLVLYGFTTAPAVLYGDGGELQLAAALAGIAHPTGYPLYLILGWLWTRLPLSTSPAHEMNLLSALMMAAAIGFFYPACRRFLRLSALAQRSALQKAIALVATALLGITRLFWSQAVSTEVYALNALIVAGMLYALFRWLENDKGWSGLIPLAIWTGLGLAHHRTTVLWLPAFALVIWLALRHAPAQRLPRPGVAVLMALLLLPLTLYLYIPLRAPHSPYLTLALAPGETVHLYDNSPAGFLYYVLGRSFEGSINPSLLGVERLETAVRLLRQQFTWLGILLGLGGLGWLLIRRRTLALAATLPTYVILVLFNLIYDIGDIAVFYLPTFMLWTLWSAVGVAKLSDWINASLPRLQPLARAGGSLSRAVYRRAQLVAGWVSTAVMAILFISLLIGNFPLVNRRHDLTAWTQWQQILVQPLPPGAVLISNDRDDMMPMWYFQHVEGLRPDLIGLFPKLVGDGNWEDVGMVLDRALASGREVYLIKPMPGLDVKVDLEPAQASLFRVRGLTSGCQATRPVAAMLGETMRLAGYTRAPYSVAPGQNLTVTLCWEPQAPAGKDYATFVQILDRAGNRLLGSDQIPGGAYYPISRWKPGEQLRDVHRLTIPPDLAPGAYRLYAGMYLYPSMERLGDADLGLIGVKAKIERQRREPPNVTDYYFGDAIILLGYELRKEGQSLLLTLEWQCLKEMEHSYTTFVHLVNEKNIIVAQADSQPLGGSYPTSIWDRGEVVMDAYRIPIEIGTPPGRYRLLIGLYRLETMKRLNISAANGTPLGDFVQLEVVNWP